MALLNDIYILAENETVDNSVETVTHPTESGMPTADMIRRKPIVLTLNGVVADTTKVDAETAIAKLKKLQTSGSLIKYIGACGTINNLQIQSFSPSYTNKVSGGATYNMTLQEARITKSAYVKVSTKKATSVKKSISVGDTVLFNGGYVYYSSDAKTSKTKKSKSTCRLTLISTLKGAKHIYHVISKDGKGVYGWVDANTVSAIGTTVALTTSGGTQQVSSSNKKTVYHTVKKGDTIWKLVTVTYKSLNTTVSKVINDNPKAFSVKGDARTLQIGARLCLKAK